jgi:hypothetical protein
MKMPANDKQVGGEHYKSDIQHWDYVHANNLDYFQAQITKYVERHKKKNGKEDLEKAMHFLEKYIELEYPSDREVRFKIGPEAFPFKVFIGNDIYNGFETSGEAIAEARLLFKEGYYGQNAITIRDKRTKELIQWKSDT